MMCAFPLYFITLMCYYTKATNPIVLKERFIYP